MKNIYRRKIRVTNFGRQKGKVDKPPPIPNSKSFHQKWKNTFFSGKSAPFRKKEGRIDGLDQFFSSLLIDVASSRAQRTNSRVATVLLELVRNKDVEEADENQRVTTNWAALDAYKDKKTGELLGPQHSFNVEFAQDNMQQISDSLDCKLFVVVYAEFLSDKINMSCNSFESSYLRKRYAILLLKHGLDKMNAGYVSNSDDPSRMKNVLNPSSEDEIVNVG
ncbi:uncharacterized protein LOC107030271 [Solanum pennellii]|uniref:Uncharacterized protein LOC107030271 n=1 Tax=Solanum pennellii TaxID=28526 RepID=A0ABM1HL54_SOLPN|nr:uncharacterized protein LOC107030271 [Solanum pennellii]